MSAPLSPGERETLRESAIRGRIACEHIPLIQRLADDLDEDNSATAAAVMRELLLMCFASRRPSP